MLRTSSVNNVFNICNVWAETQDPPTKTKDILDIINIANVLSTFVF